MRIFQRNILEQIWKKHILGWQKQMCLEQHNVCWEKYSNDLKNGRTAVKNEFGEWKIEACPILTQHPDYIEVLLLPDEE